METYTVKSRGLEYTVTVVDEATGGGTLTIGGCVFHVEYAGDQPVAAAAPLIVPALAKPSAPIGDASIVAPIPGKIVAIHVEVGDSVSVDQVVLELEAMKMENEIASHVAGTVKEIAVREGSDIALGQLLMTIG